MKPHRKNIFRLWKFDYHGGSYNPPTWKLVRRYDTRKGAEQAAKVDLLEKGLHLWQNQFRAQCGLEPVPVVYPFFWIGERPPEPTPECFEKKFPRRPKRPAAQPILVDRP